MASTTINKTNENPQTLDRTGFPSRKPTTPPEENPAELHTGMASGITTVFAKGFFAIMIGLIAAWIVITLFLPDGITALSPLSLFGAFLVTAVAATAAWICFPAD